MAKKKRQNPEVEDLLQRPWCYYCERDFDDLKILIHHQKAKHFKCDRCARRLNTAGGLRVHMEQVHKEVIEQVENALPGRESIDREIFGTEGIPESDVAAHNQRIIAEFSQKEADRRAASGQSNGPKKPKIDIAKELDPEEMRKKLEAHKKAMAAGALTPGAPAAANSPGRSQSPGGYEIQGSPQQGQVQNYPPPQSASPPGVYPYGPPPQNAYPPATYAQQPTGYPTAGFGQPPYQPPPVQQHPPPQFQQHPPPQFQQPPQQHQQFGQGGPPQPGYNGYQQSQPGSFNQPPPNQYQQMSPQQQAPPRTNPLPLPRGLPPRPNIPGLPPRPSFVAGPPGSFARAAPPGAWNPPPQQPGFNSGPPPQQPGFNGGPPPPSGYAPPQQNHYAPPAPAQQQQYVPPSSGPPQPSQPQYQAPAPLNTQQPPPGYGPIGSMSPIPTQPPPGLVGAMESANIQSPIPPQPDTPVEKPAEPVVKPKRETRLVYDDEEISPEEKRASLPQYAVTNGNATIEAAA